MKARRHLTTRLVIIALLLAAGPLKATAAFACEMMETVVHDVCCCQVAGVSRGNDGGEQAGDAAAQAMSEPCCERSMSVGVDVSALKAASASKPAGKTPLSWFDVDLPNVGLIDSMAGTPVALPSANTTVPAVTTLAYANDSRLWLTTRRLRI